MQYQVTHFQIQVGVLERHMTTCEDVAKLKPVSHTAHTVAVKAKGSGLFGCGVTHENS